MKKYDLNRLGVLRIVVLSALGHFIGGAVFYKFAIINGGDSRLYFYWATTKFQGLGAHFVFFLFGHLRELFIGDSFLGAFLFSAALGFLGSIFYLLTFKKLLDRLLMYQKYFLIDKQIIFFPTFILLCWPSYFFWSAGIGKDSLSFLSIGMFLFGLADNRATFRNILTLLLAGLLGFLVRPYLFLIVSFAIFVYVLFMSKLKLVTKIIWVLLLGLLASKLILIVAESTSLTSYSLQYVSQRAISNQSMTSNLGASSIPVPTNNYYLMYLFLPYLMLANLFLPLFYSARNFIGLISSAENLYFTILVWSFLRNRNIWKGVRITLPFVNFLMIYFLTGMAFLGLINTNMGLAMREKMMYVPAFLIVMMLVYAYNRILIFQSLFVKQVSQELKEM